MTKHVCVINWKGGCGKTTIATHLAVALAASGESLRRLIVDCPPSLRTKRVRAVIAERNIAVVPHLGHAPAQKCSVITSRGEGDGGDLSAVCSSPDDRRHNCPSG